AGSVAVSFLGGLVSSASATAAAGSLAANRQTSAQTAAICTVLASIASSLVNLPVVYRAGNPAGAVRQLTIVSAATAAIGLAVLAALFWLRG
ncbi:MAG: MgtC/SapB family protein, partial [Bryobacteraceae bacterium]